MAFIPDVGDLVWLNFDPQAGHEQAGRRPAVVLSPKLYNQRSGLGLFCPITSQSKGYPFEVVVPDGCGVAGVVLADHVKNSDWRARRASRIGRLPQETVEEIKARLAPLLGF
jgi:mRNA interferase MazF